MDLNLLKIAKEYLVQHTIDLYVARSQEVETSEFPTHFFNMGYILKSIHETIYFSHLLRDVKYGTYENIGYFKSEDSTDEDITEQFLVDVFSYYMQHHRA
jgi:hypothetical protein